MRTRGVLAQIPRIPNFGAKSPPGLRCIESELTAHLTAVRSIRLAMEVEAGNAQPPQSSEELKALVRAIRDDDHDSIIKLLEADGELVNEEYAEGRPNFPILVACKYASLATVKLLIERGARLDVMTASEKTPLLCAASGCNVEVVRYLLDHGLSKPNEMDGYGLNTAAHLCKMNGGTPTIELFQYLEQAGVDLDGCHMVFESIVWDEVFEFIKWLWGRMSPKAQCESLSAITQALIHNQPRVVQFLLENGADANMETTEGSTLTLAAEKGMIGVLRRMLAPDFVGFRGSVNDSVRGVYPIHWACSSGSLECVQLLVSKGASVHEVDQAGRTCLMYALCSPQKDNKELVSYLLTQGVDSTAVDAAGVKTIFYVQRAEDYKILASRGHSWRTRNDQGLTLLHTCQDLDLLRYLLDEHNASVDEEDENGNTPLEHAIVKQQDYEKAMLLVSYGASVMERRDRHGRTLLMLAASTENLRMVKFLLAQGVDVNAVCHQSWTALHYAATAKFANIITKALIQHGADPLLPKNGTTPFLYALTRNEPDLARFYLSFGHIDIQRDGRLALAAACGAPDNVAKENIARLIDLGLDVNLPVNQDDNRTPLMYAVENRLSSTVLLLLKKGARVNAVDAYDKTAIFYVRDVETARILVEHGADLRAKNKLSCLGEVAMHGDLECLRFLVENGAKFKKSIDKRLSLLEEALFSKREENIDYLYSHVEHLFCTDTMDRDVLKMLFKALARNKTIHSLVLNNNWYLDSLMSHIVRMLQENTHMSCLELSFNTLSYESACRLLNGIAAHNFSIVDLSFHVEKDITDSQLAKLKRLGESIVRRNANYRRDIVDTAVSMLTAARILLAPDTQWIGEIHTPPPEITSFIVRMIDRHELLLEEEKEEIIAYALDHGNVGKGIHHFLAKCLGEHFLFTEVRAGPAVSQAMEIDSSDDEGYDEDWLCHKYNGVYLHFVAKKPRQKSRQNEQHS